jgi:lysophospholipase
MELIVTSDNPAPPGGVCSNVRTSDRIVLRVARWHPEGQARGTVVLAQGRAEFIEKYFETVAELLARGFAVVTFDWRGQGLSTRAVANPRKGHVDDFVQFERDLEAVFSQAVQPFCPPPYFGLAHSTGASIMLQQARRSASPFARLVLLSPLIDIRGLLLPQGARFLADFLNVLGLGGAFIPGGGPKSIMSKPFKGNWLSSDKVRYARNAAIVEAAPHLAIGDPTVGWVHAAFRQIDDFADPDYPLRTLPPVLIIAAGGDGIVSTPAIERFGQRLKAGQVLVIEHARHEILQENDAIRGQFWAAFDAFVPGESVGEAPQSERTHQAS